MLIIRVTLVFGLSASFCLAQAPRPNVIVVLCDDLGYGDIGVNGATRIATPNLDRMAREGVRLTSFYSSANVCTPSRAGLLTGRYPIRMGLAKGVVFPQNTGGLVPEEITIAEILYDAGYRTGMVGKWHLGNKPPYWPTHAGFEEYFGVPYSNDMNPFPLYRGETMIEANNDHPTLTERYAVEAAAFIERHKTERFFLFFAHSMPHSPLAVSPKFEGKSNAGFYGDVVEMIDWSMGRVFDALKESGIDDKTLVIFTSDNGPWYEGSSGPYRDRKGSSWEGGVRVPFLARWPGVIPAGVTSGGISMNTDLLPTIAKLAGATIPTDRAIDGKDIYSLWLGGRESPHDALYFFNEDKIAAIRTQQWKFVVETYYKTFIPSFRTKTQFNYPGLLFDIDRDPAEQFSLTRDNAEIVAQMNELHDTGVRELIDPYLGLDRRNIALTGK